MYCLYVFCGVWNRFLGNITVGGHWEFENIAVGPFLENAEIVAL